MDFNALELSEPFCDPSVTDDRANTAFASPTLATNTCRLMSRGNYLKCFETELIITDPLLTRKIKVNMTRYMNLLF